MYFSKFFLEINLIALLFSLVLVIIYKIVASNLYITTKFKLKSESNIVKYYINYMFLILFLIQIIILIIYIKYSYFNIINNLSS